MRAPRASHSPSNGRPLRNERRGGAAAAQAVRKPIPLPSSTRQVRAPAEAGAGVDAEAVLPDGGRGGGRVAVHHHHRQVAVEGQEGLAYPDQVEGVLPVERHFRPDAGVDEQVVPGGPVQRAGAQHRQVPLRHQGEGLGMVGAAAVAPERFRPAIVEPELPGAGVGQRVGRVQHHHLVVADEVHHLRARDRRRAQQQLEHAGAVRPAVHVVAEVHQHGFAPPGGPPASAATSRCSAASRSAQPWTSPMA